MARKGEGATSREFFEDPDPGSAKDTERLTLGMEPAMLILTRNIDQSVRIGDEIEVTILEVQGRQVRLGIQAPRNIPIRRHELEPMDALDEPKSDTHGR